MLALSNRTILGEALLLLAGLTFVVSLVVSLAHHIELRGSGSPSAAFTSAEQLLRGLARSILVVVLGSIGGFWHFGRTGSSGVVALFMVCLIGGGAVIGISTELCVGSAEIVVAVPVPAAVGSEWLACDVLSVFDSMLRVFAELAVFAAIVLRTADVPTAMRAPWRSQLSMLLLLRRYWQLQRAHEVIMMTIFATVFGLLVSGVTLTWKGSLTTSVYFSLLDLLVWSVAVMAAVPEPDQAGGLSGCLAVLCERRCPRLCACYQRADGESATTAQFGGMKQFLRATSMGPVGLLEAVRAARERYHEDDDGRHG
jgi:hypothetical protein